VGQARTNRCGDLGEGQRFAFKIREAPNHPRRWSRPGAAPAWAASCATISPMAPDRLPLNALRFGPLPTTPATLPDRRAWWPANRPTTAIALAVTHRGPGEVAFDPSYKAGNPLGERHGPGAEWKPRSRNARGRPGSAFGGPCGSTTGRDGMGGQSFASAELSARLSSTIAPACRW